MTGTTTVNSVPAEGLNMNMNMNVERGPNSVSASYVNSFRISAVADRLAMHVCSQPRNDAPEFIHLCLSLARGIDFAIANGEPPSRSQDLPLLVKKVCRRHCDSLLLAPVMVLMMSVKNACQSGWFSEKDTEELQNLANEISGSFCSVLDFKTEPSSSQTIISTVMSRFYPRLKMGQILAFLEVQPGYGTFVNDFQITKNMQHSERERVRLFVAQIDNLESSLCLISPPQVNFLLNGKGVERRTNVSVDSGPQLPSLVPHMLKYGTNLLQAVGQFNGSYIIAVAYMSEISTPVHTTLPDYEQPPAASIDSDSEIIEGPSRISLNCPISFRRINTPVKGRSCKHLQCFDFDNYVDINSRRPSWRCPHCNQHVCFTDIHIDQEMVKVLKEVGVDVTDVIISSDGSWKAIMESDDHTEKPRGNTPDCAQDSPPRGSNGLPNAPADVLDLTEIGDEMYPIITGETEDRKSNVQSAPVVHNPNEVGQTVAPHMMDEFWSGIYLSSYGLGTSSLQAGSVTGPTATNLMQSPVLTDAISPAHNQEAGSAHETALIPTSVLQSGISSPNMLQLQQFQFGNSAMSNEYGSFPSAARHANRTPVAVQALPVQPTPVPQQRRSTMIPLLHSGSSTATQDLSSVSLNAYNVNNIINSVELQQYSIPDSNMLQAPRMASSALPQHTSAQRSFAPRLPSQQMIGLQAPNPSTQYAMSQSLGLTQSSTQPSAAGLSRAQIHQGSSQGGVTQPTGLASGQHARFLAVQRAQMRGVQTSRNASPLPGSGDAFRTPLVGDQRGNMGVTSPVILQTSRTASPLPGSADGFRTPLGGDQRGNMGGTSPVTRIDASMDSQMDPNWRPTGRMRGSLSGRAYSDALKQFIIQPTQQAQAARPSISSTVSPQLQVLMANRVAHSTQPVNLPSTTPANSPDISGVLPERSSRMQ